MMSLETFATAVVLIAFACQGALCDHSGGPDGSCATLFNTDFPGSGILNNGKTDKAFLNSACCAKCEDHPSCKVWTRITRTAGGSTAGECWLRSFKPQAKYCSHCASGVNSCGVLGNTDFPSQDGILNGGKPFFTSSNAQCCRKCNARSDCQAWTRIKKDTEYNKAGECWLRSFVPNRKYCAECDSGSKPSG